MAELWQINTTAVIKIWVLLHITAISSDDQIQRAPAKYYPLSLSEDICEAMQIVIGSQGREALPVFEMLPVHNSLDRILGFKNYTNRCARLARAKHS